MPGHLPGERSSREHANADGAHAVLVPEHRELIEVLAGKPDGTAWAAVGFSRLRQT